MVANDNIESVQVLTSVFKEIEQSRRKLQEVMPALATSESDVVNLARQQLCSALVLRLEIAERQLKELREMLELNLKA
jgi:hypothetical protein